MCPQNCRAWCHLILSAVGLFLGLSAFISFMWVYKNVDAAFWALFSGVFAALCCHLHWLLITQRLESWYTEQNVDSLKTVGLCGLLAGLASLAWYIFLALYHHVPMLPVKGSMYIAAVWAFMSFKWGLMLMWSSHHYIRVLRAEPPLIRI